LGSLKLNLTASFAQTPLQFTGYIVDGLHIKLIESDNDGTGTGFGSTTGVAIGQGANTARFTSNQSFAGNYVFRLLGHGFSGLPTSLASVGQFTADTSGNLTGHNDEEPNGLVSRSAIRSAALMCWIRLGPAASIPRSVSTRTVRDLNSFSISPGVEILLDARF
jgi:hypothetical protein